MSKANNRLGIGALAVLPVLGVIAWIGCQNSHGADPPVTPTPTDATPVVARGTAGANSAPANQVPAHDPFDGERAYDLLKKQCDFGVRPLGTPAHEKLRDYLIAEMKKYADQTVLQEFQYRKMPVTNIIGVFYAQGATRPSAHPILLMAHWDTRPIADGPFSSETKRGVVFRYGPNGWQPMAPIMGADDGGSGVAVLLELARLFKEKRPPVGVLLLLDDGEDYGDFLANNNQGDGVELGSRYFAKHFRESKAFGTPSYGILLDMVGAKNVFFAREKASQDAAPSVNDRVFGIAQSLGYGNVFHSNDEQAVNDDHVALIAEGIPMIDLIHPLPYSPYDTTGYVYWHTLQDTPDKCSAKALKTVGDVIAETVYEEIPEAALPPPPAPAAGNK